MEYEVEVVAEGVEARVNYNMWLKVWLEVEQRLRWQLVLPIITYNVGVESELKR